MEATKRQSYWWWFDSHNSPRRSQWLQSTITELDQKTKAMLRLIEQDADSFAQRAEMYYKKRPDLISMVEDFYRAHRSLAERFDQLRNDPVNRITSPLAHSLSFPKGQLREVASNLYNSFDSYSNKGYDSEDSAELSEVDDPVQEDSNLIGKGMEEEEVSSPHAVVYEDVTKLKKEIDGLKEENKIQTEIIHREEKAKQELKVQLSGSSNELQTLREEIERLRKERTLIMMQQNDEKCDEITKLREDNKIQKQLVKREEKAKEELKMQLSETNNELQKLREQIEELRKEKTVMMMQRDEKCDEMTNKREEMGRLEVENRVQKEQLMQKDEEKREVIRQLSLAMEMIREENLLLKKSIVKGTPKKRSNPLEFYGFKSLGKLFHSSSTMSQSRSSVVVPL